MGIIKCFAVSEEVTTRVRMPYSRFTTRLLLRCSKSAQKSTVQLCQIPTVVMQPTQLVLSQFKNFYRSQWRLE